MNDKHTRFPDPIVSVSITPTSADDELRLARALSALSNTDKTFRVNTDPEHGHTIVSGMSESHLEIIVMRLRVEFKVSVAVSAPRVAYRETIRKRVREEGKFLRQSRARDQFGHVVLELEPNQRGKGFEFHNTIPPGKLPQEFIPAVEKGVREALDGGALAGYPIIDIKVFLVGGSFQDVVSDERAFYIAGAMALRSGCKKASPTLLEPFVKCEVTTPEQFMGDVIGDLNSRRAKIQDMGDRGQLKFVRCSVPVAEMFGYATILRSITQGSAAFTMEPSHYEEIPPDKWRASIDPHSPDEPPTASAGRPVLPIRPKPGLSGGSKRQFPSSND